MCISGVSWGGGEGGENRTQVGGLRFKEPLPLSHGEIGKHYSSNTFVCFYIIRQEHNVISDVGLKQYSTRKTVGNSVTESDYAYVTQ